MYRLQIIVAFLFNIFIDICYIITIIIFVVVYLLHIVYHIIFEKYNYFNIQNSESKSRSDWLFI